MTRPNLAYSTVCNDRHTITVATWDDPDGLGYRIMVDSVELAAGRVTAA